jgi:hypothetical protein
VDEFHAELSDTVHILGDSMFPFKLAMVNEEGRFFQADGWADFVAVERISCFDLGLFVLTRLHRFVFRLYSHC